jgi:hypothetical protein
VSDVALQALTDRQTDRFFGKYRGLVLENTDPTMRGRITAMVPEVLGVIPSGWAEPCVPYAGTTSGFYALPPIGGGVWIEFEAGDPSRPIWTGCWWAAGEAPVNEQLAPPTPFRKILRTETGLQVSLDDIAQTITVSDIAGLNILSLKVLEGTIEVQALGRVVLEAPLIQHGAAAVHPAVLGDELLAYLTTLVTIFNTHLHPGELAAGVIPVTPAPAVAPMPPPLPTLLSIKNLVE